MARRPLSEMDRALMSLLKKNGRITWTDAARALGISRISVQKRAEALQEAGWIAGYTAIVHEPGNRDDGVRAFLRIRFARGNDCFKLSSRFGNDSSVEGIWAVTGGWDAIMLLKAASLEAISDFRELIVATGGIDEIETEAVLNELARQTVSNK